MTLWERGFFSSAADEELGVRLTSVTSTRDGSRRASEQQRHTTGQAGVRARHSGPRASLVGGAASTAPALSTGPLDPWTKLLPSWLRSLREAALCDVSKDKWCRPGWAWSKGAQNQTRGARGGPGPPPLAGLGPVRVSTVLSAADRQVQSIYRAILRLTGETGVYARPACTRDGQLRCPSWTSQRGAGPASPSACVPGRGRLPNPHVVQPWRL